MKDKFGADVTVYDGKDSIPVNPTFIIFDDKSPDVFETMFQNEIDRENNARYTKKEWDQINRIATKVNSKAVNKNESIKIDRANAICEQLHRLYPNVDLRTIKHFHSVLYSMDKDV